ncbi:MAG: hypothetical protein ACNA7W_07865 [Pseudomonadales bacterium]
MPSNCRLEAWLVLLVLMGGCQVQLGPEAPDTAPTRTYWLEPPQVQVETHPGEVRVTAVPGLDSQQMLALDADNLLVPYAGARWSGPVPQLLRSLVIQSLGAGQGDEPLHLEVRRFFVERDAGEFGVATVEFAAWLPQRSPQPELFIAREPLEQERLGAVAAAFQRAIDQSMADLANWLSRAP